jgi:peptide/nickel transport system substrate-binding protein
MKKALIPLALIMVVILLVTGCGGSTTATTSQTSTTTTTSKTTSSTITTVKPMSSTTTATSATTTVTQIKKGGTLRYIYPYSPTSTPGWPADNSNFQRMWMLWTVFEPLVKPDKNYQPTPWLAESWDWGPNHMSITFHLRKNVKYHDGSTFTSENVKFQGDIVIGQSGAAAQIWDKWEIIDDNTIKLTLKKYQNDFWGGFMGIGMAFPSVAAYKAHGGADGGEAWCKEHPIGTGPFTFEYFEKDVTMKLKAFKNYWQPGKPYVDELHFITVAETLTAQSTMQAGEGDVWALQQAKQLYDMKNAGFNIVYDYGGTDFLLFDTMNADSVTNDVKVRMAVEYAIDKQAMADALGYGFLIPNNQWSPPFNPTFNADLPSREYNPAMARALLTSAGFPDGCPVKIITIGAEAEILSVQQYLEAVGFKVTLESVDNAKFWNYCSTSWQGMLNVGYAIGSANFAAALKGYFGPTSFIDKSCKIPDAVLAKVDAALLLQDAAAMKKANDEIIKDLYDYVWMVPFYSNAMGFILRTDIKDSGIENFADWSQWSPENVWLDR